MSEDGFWVKALTPKDTEEVKPGLFIQKKLGRYRQVHPSAWDGKVIKKNLFFGGDFVRSFIFFAILMFIVWSYQHDVQAYQDFYLEVSGDPLAYCSDVQTAINVPCTEQNERLGLCTNFPDGSNQLDLGDILIAEQ